MRTIAKDTDSNTYYVLNHDTYQVEWVDTDDGCRTYIKAMKSHDFYYSVKDMQGRDRVPSVTLDYFEMMANYYRLYPASE